MKVGKTNISKSNLQTEKTKRMKVLKFGGTSVGTIKRIQHVANIVQKEHAAGNQIIVVVSAMSGKTNELINFSKEISIVMILKKAWADILEYTHTMLQA